MIYFSRQEQRIIILVGIIGLIGIGVILIKRFQPEWYMLSSKGRPDFDVVQDSDEPENKPVTIEKAQETNKPDQANKDDVVKPIGQRPQEIETTQTQKQDIGAKAPGLHGKININTATIDELKSLPRIGDVIGGRIIDYRQKNGDFKSIDELTKVNGIGSMTLQRLKDLVTVED